MDDKPDKTLNAENTNNDTHPPANTRAGHTVASTGRPRKRMIPTPAEEEAAPARPQQPKAEDMPRANNRKSQPTPAKGPQVHQSIVMEAPPLGKPDSTEKKANDKTVTQKKKPQNIFEKIAENRQKKNAEQAANKQAAAENKKVKQAAAGEYAAAEDEDDNSIPLPTTRKRKRSRKRFWRKVRAFSFLGVFLLILFLVATGAYRFGVLAVQEMTEGIKIAASPGNGFPMDYALTGYKGAVSMGNNGFAVLGDLDMSIVSSSGKELRRIQHGFVRPGVVAGNNRVCVYSRGGKEYLIEGRSKTIKRGTTENEITLAAMSPNGWLALSTTNGRYLSEIEVFNPVGDSVLKWSSNKDVPNAMAFYNNGSVLAVASLRSQDGALTSHIELLRMGKDKPIATIDASEGIVLQMSFVGSNRLLVIYNSGFAGLYDLSGELRAKYDYQSRPVSSASIGNRYTAFLFGSVTQGNAELVVINHTMEQTADVTVPILNGAALLSADNNIYMLLGQEVAVFSSDGTLQQSNVQASRPLGLVYGGQPLLIRVGAVDSLSENTKKDEAVSGANPSSSDVFGASIPSSVASVP